MCNVEVTAITRLSDRCASAVCPHGTSRKTRERGARFEHDGNTTQPHAMRSEHVTSAPQKSVRRTSEIICLIGADNGVLQWLCSRLHCTRKPASVFRRPTPSEECDRKRGTTMAATNRVQLMFTNVNARTRAKHEMIKIYSNK